MSNPTTEYTVESTAPKADPMSDRTSSETEPSSTPASSSPALKPSEVALQIGVYELHTIPDWQIVGPTLVIYGDGRVYTTTQDASFENPTEARHMHGQLTQQQVQELVSEATRLPATDQTGVTAVDEWPQVVLVGDQAWSIYASSASAYHAFLRLAGDLASGAATEAWQPDAWIALRAPTLTCEVVVQAAPLYAVPVFPEFVDRYPVGPMDCTTV